MKTKPSEINPFGYTRKGFAFDQVEQFEPKTVLDYGAHDGEFIAALADAGLVKEAVGVDLNHAVVETNSSHMPDGAKLLGIERGVALPFPDGHFDMVCMLDVLEHVLDQGALLRELNRVTRPGGALVVTVPRRYPLSFLDTGNWKFAFPRLHKKLFELVNSPEEYETRYVTCPNSLFGDIELGKARHQHFTERELSRLLAAERFRAITFDASGLFNRLLVLSTIVLKRDSLLLSSMLDIDARTFRSSNLFSLSLKAA